MYSEAYNYLRMNRITIAKVTVHYTLLYETKIYLNFKHKCGSQLLIDFKMQSCLDKSCI